MRGRFITLEGMDGAGKSSHIESIVSVLEGRGLEVVSTREPGGTPLGEKLRELLLHERMHVETETLLMFAARREHIAEVIEPALARGAWVVSDRFTDASFAYQCGGRGVPCEKVEALEAWVHPDLQPDLTLLFDVPVEISVARLAAARTPDKFERESAEFFRRIRNGYLARAEAQPQRFRLIDGNRPMDTVRKEVLDIMREFKA
ncbi:MULTISPECIES: dTMP kinase [Methylobacillus]|uniref:Thymidylate kinase n=1 Tax=Methylobacillus flagellatus (strain ATCC 51484 / DSM 6875 / VKM B-1610 / KT) TaxID=265072 RepID=KTHY_METFK|nr:MULTISPECIES: dTMP kinase [Methylobacillus]Q1H169.1 RecName: Full=Thymidylate kinase; AltName: Full=dTMP kinase [Methylobacillus flagellatus KT]ABE49768.1 thymidylate kinase [Methylobacillus flagellatus KT]MPS49005.1 dTMP kinase [Methylobacillus sp.]